MKNYFKMLGIIKHKEKSVKIPSYRGLFPTVDPYADKRRFLEQFLIQNPDRKVEEAEDNYKEVHDFIEKQRKSDIEKRQADIKNLYSSLNIQGEPDA